MFTRVTYVHIKLALICVSDNYYITHQGMRLGCTQVDVIIYTIGVLSNLDKDIIDVYFRSNFSLKVFYAFVTLTTLRET